MRAAGGVRYPARSPIWSWARGRRFLCGWPQKIGDDGSEKPRLQAAGKVPTVAAMGSRAPKGAATKHTEQSAHQAAIWVALEYKRAPAPLEA